MIRLGVDLREIENELRQQGGQHFEPDDASIYRDGVDVRHTTGSGAKHPEKPPGQQTSPVDSSSKISHPLEAGAGLNHRPNRFSSHSSDDAPRTADIERVLTLDRVVQRQREIDEKRRQKIEHRKRHRQLAFLKDDTGNGHDQLAEGDFINISLPRWMRPLLGEAVGIMVMIILGTGSNIQSNLNTETPNYVAYTFGWGVGLMMGLMIAIPVSGGHLNPAITLTQALFRGFPWKLVLPYMFAQIVGAFVGAVITNGVFYDVINNAEGAYGLRTYYGENATAYLFVTIPASYDGNVAAFFEQVVGSSLLILGVAIVTDDDIAKDWSIYVKSIVMMWVMTAVSGCMGVRTAFALNPARDLGPRIACAAFGYPSALWTDRHGFFFYGGILGPFVGAVWAMVWYDLCFRRSLHLTIPGLHRKNKSKPRTRPFDSEVGGMIAYPNTERGIAEHEERRKQQHLQF